MGIAAASLEGNSCEEQVQFWKLWNESSQDKRHEMGVQIARTTAELLKTENKSARDARKELAQFVKTLINKRGGPTSGSTKRKRKS